jgi:hypothetical protein
MQITEQKNTYNVVVLGGMNPRIHHPAWYRTVGLLSEAETEAALKAPQTFAALPVAQVQTPEMVIFCQEERWEIRTSNENMCDRIINITIKLFDDILPHTPVSAAGYNFFLWKETTRDANAYLATALTNAHLGLKGDDAISGEATVRRSTADHSSQVTIKPSPENRSRVLVHHNFEYRFLKEGPFKLAETFERRYGVDKKEAEEQTAMIIEAINRSTQD